MPENVKSWKTKAEAAAYVGVSEKAIERAGNRKVDPIRNEWRREPGKKPCRVYHPEDIEKLRASIPRQVTGEIVDDVQLALAEGPAQGRPPVLQLLPAPERKLLLTLPEASAYSGLTRAFLLRAINTGNLPALRDRGWKVRRADIKAFVEKPRSSGQTSAADDSSL